MKKDIGVIIDCELSFNKHRAEKVNKFAKIIHIIRRSFMYPDEEIFVNLHKAFGKTTFGICQSDLGTQTTEANWQHRECSEDSNKAVTRVW